MKNVLILFLVFLLTASFHSTSATNIPGGYVSGHWTLSNSPYLVLGDLVVPQDSTLEIDAGVFIQFQAHYSLKVLGRVLAMGNVNSHIIFTAPTDWGGIRFENTTSSQDSSLFISCDVQAGYSHGGNAGNGGAFYISNFHKVRIENCALSNNHAELRGGAVYCFASSIVMKGDTLTDNHADTQYGGGVAIYYSVPLISNCVFIQNPGSIYLSGSPALVQGNTVSNNTINCSIYCDNSDAAIIENLVTNSNDKSIYSTASSPTIIGNVIAGGYSSNYGGGICCQGGNPVILNNTIVNNRSDIYGGGLSVQYSCSCIVKNNIFWNNTSGQGNQVYIDATSAPEFYNCDIENGMGGIYAQQVFTGPYVNNINTDPLFVNAALNDYRLLAVSPCFNAGDTTGINLPLTDLAGSPRICDGMVDIGAYEICINGIPGFTSGAFDLNVHPNPAQGKVIFEIHGAGDKENMELQIMDPLGKITRQVFPEGAITTIQLEGVSPGMYFYLLRDDMKILSSGKIIIE